VLAKPRATPIKREPVVPATPAPRLELDLDSGLGPARKPAPAPRAIEKPEPAQPRAASEAEAQAPPAPAPSPERPTMRAPEPEPAPAPAPKPEPALTPAPPAASLESTDPRHRSARKLARLAVSEIKLYNEKLVAEGLSAGNLYAKLDDQIDQAIALYDQRTPKDVRAEFDYLHDELTRQLGGGDESKLGPGYAKKRAR
jgi:hypothetical protein